MRRLTPLGPRGTTVGWGAMPTFIAARRVCYTMPYDLSCDTCRFDRTVPDEPKAYAVAKEHEGEHPTHYVLIHTAETPETPGTD